MAAEPPALSDGSFAKLTDAEAMEIHTKNLNYACRCITPKPDICNGF